MYLGPLCNEVPAGDPLEITNFLRRQPRDFAPNFVIFARAATGSVFAAATKCKAVAERSGGGTLGVPQGTVTVRRE